MSTAVTADIPNFGDFFVGHSSEESKLHDLGFFGDSLLPVSPAPRQGKQIVR